mgnify:CR=1 FL=1
MGTLIVGAILILIVGLIIRGIVRDKKSGKSSLILLFFSNLMHNIVVLGGLT